MENHTIVYSHEGRSHFHFSITMIKQNSSSNSKSSEEKQNTTYKEHYVWFVYIYRDNNRKYTIISSRFLPHNNRPLKLKLNGN